MTPTIIRRFISNDGDTTAVVIAHATGVRSEPFLVTFQVYRGLRIDGIGHLSHSSPWPTEQGAIKEFEEWLPVPIISCGACTVAIGAHTRDDNCRLDKPVTLEERDAADLAAGRDPLTGDS